MALLVVFGKEYGRAVEPRRGMVQMEMEEERREGSRLRDKMEGEAAGQGMERGGWWSYWC